MFKKLKSEAERIEERIDEIIVNTNDLERIRKQQSPDSSYIYIKAIDLNLREEDRLRDKLNTLNHQYNQYGQRLANEMDTHGQFIIQLKRLQEEGY